MNILHTDITDLPNTFTDLSKDMNDLHTDIDRRLGFNGYLWIKKMILYYLF